MSLYLMITIADRARFPGIVALYQQRNVLSSFITLGHGTATGELLNYFGLVRSEKAVCLSVITGDLWSRVKQDLERKIHIDVPGIGVAFTIPLSSIGGKRELAFLTEKQGFEKKEESVMRGTERELLIIISNQGFHDLVMAGRRRPRRHGHSRPWHRYGTRRAIFRRFSRVRKRYYVNRHEIVTEKRDYESRHGTRRHGIHGEIHRFFPARDQYGGSASVRRR